MHYFGGEMRSSGRRCIPRCLLFVCLCQVALTVMAGVSMKAVAHGFHEPQPEQNAEINNKTLQFWEQRYQQRPDNVITLSHLAKFFLDRARQTQRHDDYRQSETYFTEWLAIAPKSIGGRTGLAYALVGQHRFAEALEHARTVVRLSPGESSAMALIGDIHLSLGNLQEAEMAYEFLANRDGGNDALVRLASLYEARGDYQRAFSLTKSACDDQSSVGSAGYRNWCLTRLGEISLLLGSSAEAERYFSQAVAQSEVSTVASWRLGVLQARCGKMQSARQLLQELASRDPRPRHWIALGDAHRQIAELSEAEALYKKAEQRMESDVERGDIGHIRELAEFWLSDRLGQNRLERHLKALTLAERDLQEVRQDAGAYLTLAWAHYRLGQYEKAGQAVSRALSDGSRDPEWLLRGAMIFHAGGDRGLAQKLYGQVDQDTVAVPQELLTAARQLFLSDGAHRASTF